MSASTMTVRIALAGAVVLALAACGESGDVTQELVQPTSAQELVSTSIGDLVVLDIRTPEEFAGPHLEGAVNIDFYVDDFAAQLDQLDRTVPYLVYCRSGNRTSQAMPVMADLGFQTVYEVDGGIIAWADAGLPLTP